MKNNLLMILLYVAFAALAVVFSGSKKPLTKIVEVSKADTIELILNIIKEKEGAGCCDVGDGGKAYGVYQIHKNAVKDVNKRFKTKYTHKDMFNENKARDVAKLYLKIGREYFIKKRKKEPTINEYLKMYNGGCFNGWNNRKAEKYI